MIHSTAVIDDGAEIGEGTKVWHFSHVMPGARIGRDCVLGQNVFIGANVRIGDRVHIQNNVSVYEGVELEDDVFCGPSCVFTNVKNPRVEFPRKGLFQKTQVLQGATIGANATIVCGVTIGRWAMIGAGAVVIGDVGDFALMTGVPARRKGWVSRRGVRLDAELRCPESGKEYLEAQGTLREL